MRTDEVTSMRLTARAKLRHDHARYKARYDRSADDVGRPVLICMNALPSDQGNRCVCAITSPIGLCLDRDCRCDRGYVRYVTGWKGVIFAAAGEWMKTGRISVDEGALASDGPSDGSGGEIGCCITDRCVEHIGRPFRRSAHLREDIGARESGHEVIRGTECVASDRECVNQRAVGSTLHQRASHRPIERRSTTERAKQLHRTQNGLVIRSVHSPGISSTRIGLAGCPQRRNCAQAYQQQQCWANRSEPPSARFNFRSAE